MESAEEAEVQIDNDCSFIQDLFNLRAERALGVSQFSPLHFTELRLPMSLPKGSFLCPPPPLAGLPQHL